MHCRLVTPLRLHSFSFDSSPIFFTSSSIHRPSQRRRKREIKGKLKTWKNLHLSLLTSPQVSSSILSTSYSCWELIGCAFDLVMTSRVCTNVNISQVEFTKSLYCVCLAGLWESWWVGETLDVTMRGILAQSTESSASLDRKRHQPCERTPNALTRSSLHTCTYLN